MYADEDDKDRHSESQQMLQQDLDADADKNDTARDFGLFPVFIAGPAADLNPGETEHKGDEGDDEAAEQKTVLRREQPGPSGPGAIVTPTALASMLVAMALTSRFFSRWDPPWGCRRRRRPGEPPRASCHR